MRSFTQHCHMQSHRTAWLAWSQWGMRELQLQSFIGTVRTVRSKLLWSLLHGTSVVNAVVIQAYKSGFQAASHLSSYILLNHWYLPSKACMAITLRRLFAFIPVLCWVYALTGFLLLLCTQLLLLLVFKRSTCCSGAMVFTAQHQLNKLRHFY